MLALVVASASVGFVAHGVAVARPTYNQIAVRSVDSWYDTGKRVDDPKEPNKFDSFFETWESRLRHLNLDFWDAYDEMICYEMLEQKSKNEQLSAGKKFAGKSKPLGWPIRSGALIELREPLDASIPSSLESLAASRKWFVARVRGYDWATAQHEVEYVNRKQDPIESLLLSEHEWRFPDKQ